MLFIWLGENRSGNIFRRKGYLKRFITHCCLLVTQWNVTRELYGQLPSNKKNRCAGDQIFINVSLTPSIWYSSCAAGRLNLVTRVSPQTAIRFQWQTGPPAVTSRSINNFIKILSLTCNRSIVSAALRKTISTRSCAIVDIRLRHHVTIELTFITCSLAPNVL